MHSGTRARIGIMSRLKRLFSDTFPRRLLIMLAVLLAEASSLPSFGQTDDQRGDTTDDADMPPPTWPKFGWKFAPRSPVIGLPDYRDTYSSEPVCAALANALNETARGIPPLTLPSLYRPWQALYRHHDDSFDVSVASGIVINGLAPVTLLKVHFEHPERDVVYLADDALVSKFKGETHLTFKEIFDEVSTFKISDEDFERYFERYKLDRIFDSGLRYSIQYFDRYGLRAPTLGPYEVSLIDFSGRAYVFLRDIYLEFGPVLRMSVGEAPQEVCLLASLQTPPEHLWSKDPWGRP